MADQVIKETFTVTFTYEMSINTDTGEILDTKLTDRSISKPSTKLTKADPKKKVEQDESPIPKLTLDSTKCYLNTAAVALMGIGPDDRVDIKYENGTPIIGSDEFFGTKGGNRVSKNNTFACRGNKNSELSKHGNEFVITPHPNRQGLFILNSGEENVERLVGDNNVNISEEDEVLDLSLDELIDDTDANITEINSNFFKL